jgi:predicted flap endonuclease-1-like 5' DNA nuclease
MDWGSFIAGLLIGWLIELAIDWFYWRRREAAVAAPAPVEGMSLAEHRSRWEAAEGRVRQLEAELDAARQARGAELAGAQAEIGRLQAELSAARAAPSLQVAGQEEIIRLRSVAAEQDGCAEELAAAQTEIARLRRELDELQPVEPSDLKIVEGIGPKIEGILNAAGILTFRQLASTSAERLQAILSEAGERYRLADSSSWAEQARLAAGEQWDALAQLQDELKGGREQGPPEMGGPTPA